LDSFQGDIRKLKPPTSNDENKRGENVEVWLLGITKDFQLHDYSSNLEASITIYHLQENISMWWDQLKLVKCINEKRFLGSSSRIISSSTIFQSITFIKLCRSCLNSSLSIFTCNSM
jgi:hypothetical protein